jgi:hypothetical protein
LCEITGLVPTSYSASSLSSEEILSDAMAQNILTPDGFEELLFDEIDRQIYHRGRDESEDDLDFQLLEIWVYKVIPMISY